jgi:hypothetical protein
MSKQWNLNPQPMRQGKRREPYLPAGVAQQGQHVGNHVMEQGHVAYGGLEINSGVGRGFDPVPQGNDLAEKTQCGPGGSRKVMRSGGQGTW